MRWIIGCFVVISFGFQTANASEQALTPQHLLIDLDWSKQSAQRESADEFQEKGLLPVPIVKIGGAWKSLLPARIPLPESGNIRVEVGVTQFVERPLYVIDIERAATGTLRVHVIYPDISVASDYKFSERVIGALVIKRIVISDPFILPSDGKIQLPAEPYASIVSFAKLQKVGLRDVGIFPVIHQDDGNVYPPLATEFKGYELGMKALASGEVPAVYKRNIEPKWLEATSTGIFTAPPPERIRLVSKPTHARIYVGEYFHGENTEATIDEPENLWTEIILRKRGFDDCPVDSKKIVRGSDTVATFMCILAKQ